MAQIPGKRPRVWWQRLLFALFLLAALPMAVLALTRTRAVREYVRQQTELGLRSELGLRAVVADVDLEPQSLAIVARGITLDHPQHGRFIHAKLLRIRPSWWALAQLRVDLHTITIDEAAVRLVVRDGRLVNGPVLKPSDGGKPSVDLPVNKVWIKRSRLSLSLPTVSAELPQIDLYVDSTERKVLGLTLSARGGRIRHARGIERVDLVEARAKLTDENAQLELLRVVSHRALGVVVRNATVDLPGARSYRGEIDVALHLPHLARLPLEVELPELRGDLRLQASVTGDAQGVRGTAKLLLRDGGIDQYGFGEQVALSLTLEPERVRFEGTTQNIRDGGSVDLAGALGLGAGLPLRLRARVHDVSFAKLMELLGVSPDAIVDWNLAGAFELNGTLDPLQLAGPLRMPTTGFRITRDAYHATPARPILAIASANLAGGVKVTPRGILLHDIDVGMRHSKLHVPEVLLGFDNALRVRALGELLDLQDVTPLVGFALAGTGGFEARVDGTFTEPVVGGRVHFADFAFASYPFGDLESDFVLEKEVQAVRFPKLLAKKNGSRYQAEDFVLDFRDRRLDVSARLSLGALAMQDFYHVFHYEDDERYTPYQGEVSGAAQLHYTLGFPGDSPRGTLLADIDVDVHDAEFSGFRFQSGHFTGSFKWLDHAKGYRGGVLDVERFALRKGGGTVSLSGRMSLGGALDFVAAADALEIEQTEGLSERMPDLAGTYNAAGTVKGVAASPRVELELAAAALRYGAAELGSARTYLRLTDKDDPWIKEALSWKPGAPPVDAVCGHAREGLARGVWPADPPLHTSDGPLPALDGPMAYVICGDVGDGAMRIDLAVGRTRVYPLRGELELHDFRFGALLPHKGKGNAPKGSVSGLLRLRGGALLSPTTLEGDLRVDALSLGQLGVTLRNDGPLLASFARGRFDVERAVLAGPASTLEVRGGGSLQGGLGVTLRGSVDLGILPSFVHELSSATGRLELDCKLTGQLDRPAVFGRAAVEGAALRGDALPAAISNIDGRISFSAQRIVFEHFGADLLGGRLSWSGAAALRGRALGSYRFDLAADGLEFSPREGVELTLGGQTVLSWQRGERLPKLGGTLRLQRMRYTRPITVGRTLRDLAKRERSNVETYDPNDDLLALDLRVVDSEPMHVENNLIDAEIGIDDAKQPFRLVGTDQRFGMLGNMSIRRGKLRLRDTSFDIKEGELTFDSAVRVAPSFDVRAVTDVRRNAEVGQTSWHIGVHAWGTPESFQFSLTSDPFLSEDDIALLLTVGMTHAELAQLQTSSLTGTAALEALATVTGVEREVQRALPEIDDVHIASSYSERSNRTEPQLHLGKRIADRVRLDASTGLSESRDFTTGVEYQISDKTSVGAVYNNQTSTSASQLGDVGVDLKWRLEFD